MVSGTAKPESETAFPQELGDKLEALLIALRRAELRIGPREHVAAHKLTAELVARGRVKTLGDLRFALQPLLARSALEREAFALVFDAHAPETRAVDGPGGGAGKSNQKVPAKVGQSARIYALVGLLLVAAAGGGLWWLWQPGPTGLIPVDTEAGGYSSGKTVKVDAPASTIEKEPQPTDEEWLDRIAEAAKDYSGAPTLEELAREVAQTTSGPREISVINAGNTDVESVAMTSDGKFLVTGSRDGIARVWDAKTFREIARYEGHSSAIWNVATTPDNTKVVTSSRDGTARVWQLVDGRQILRIEGSPGPTGIAISADGTRLWAGGRDRNVRAWDLRSGKRVFALSGHSDSVLCVAVSGDNRLVVSGSDDKTARVWDSATGQLVHKLVGHEGSIFGVAVSRDGAVAVTASEDQTARVWDLSSGRQTAILRGHIGRVTAVAMTPNGKRIVTGGDDRTVRVWDRATGNGLEVARGHKGLIWSVNISAAGDIAFSGSGDQTARVWDISTNRGIGWSPQAYAIKLHEWTGLPLSVPIAIYGQDGKDGSNWAKLALALSRIEQPGPDNPKPRELLEKANANLSAREPAQIPIAYRLAPLLEDWFNGKPDNDAWASREAKLIKAAASGEIKGPHGTPVTARAWQVHRALAIAPGVEPPPEFHRTAHWRTSTAPIAMAAQYASPWAPWIAALFPIAFAAFWFANSLALRKAYLRRRTPELPPLHTDIVSEIRRKMTSGRGLFRRIAQRLLVRTPETTTDIDIPATIALTIRSGARHITPAYAEIRRTPEYLVLIERQSIDDQEAGRMSALVNRISDMVPVTTYFFDGDVAMLEPEHGGRPMPIEHVAAAHADHRLIVLGTGEGLLDAISLKPHPASQKLTEFRHRALLTPLPLAEWGREEFALAHELNLPVGRATPDGMARLSELLGLEGTEDGDRIDPRGDGLARALPDMLRSHPERFFYSAPPGGDIELPQILRELRNFLDKPGFEWLCALAVYPAVQWDLTLYLGLTMAAEKGGDADITPMYREDRVAALTQLPWLREGIMPNWLRRALIAELAKAGRADEVRDALHGLIEHAKEQGEKRRENDVQFRIAREAPKEGFDPEELYDDEVLLDFMARGRVEDFALPRMPLLEAIFGRKLLERIGVPGLVAGLVALVYAAAAWWVTPKTDGLPWGAGLANVVSGSAADPLPLVTGAWLPLVALAGCAVVALALADFNLTFRFLRGAVMGAAVPVLALGFGCCFVLFTLLSVGLGLFNHGNGWTEAYAFGTAAMSLFLARWMGGIVGLPIGQSGRALWQRFLLGFGAVAILAVALFPAYAFLVSDWFLLVERRLQFNLNSLPAPGDGLLKLAVVLLPFAAVFCLGLFAARWLPESLPVPKKRSSRTARAIGWVKVCAAISLIAFALWLAHHVAHTTIRLQPVAPGSAILAETMDGKYFAIGDASGNVHLYDRVLPNEPVDVISTELGPIASLAIARGKPSGFIVAAGSANGRTVVKRSGENWSRYAQDPYAWASKLQSHGHAPHVALGDQGRLLVVVEDDQGHSHIVTGANRALALNGTGSITAIAALDQTGHFAVATMDGGVRAVEALPNGPPSLLAPGSQPVRFKNSRARRLTYSRKAGEMMAFADDGSVIRARLDGASGGLAMLGKPERDERAALGPAVPWDRSIVSCASSAVLVDIAGQEARCLDPGNKENREFQDCKGSVCGPRMVIVPAGSFMMGSPGNESGTTINEVPQHEVVIQNPFAAGILEVTWNEWEVCVSDGGCRRTPSDESRGRGQGPVTNVSWSEAKSYAYWLSKKTRKSYRLLSEAEWEYVARAGTTTRYSWGELVGQSNANCDGCGSQWDNKQTAPVGSFNPNKFGLYDMHGNVWEWTEDCWNEHYQGAPNDGSVWTSGDCGRRVLRGGSWDSGPDDIRSSGRVRDGFLNSHQTVGFRIGRTLTP